jgi:hypothetical protein
MSETATHTRGEETNRHPITGEPAGIAEILERRSNGEADPEERGTETEVRREEPREDDAERAAREVASLRNRASEAEARAGEERAARVRAEQQAAAALQGAEDTGFTAITTALGAATREKEGLTAEMRTAGEAGDYGRIAEISARLGELGAEIRDLSRGRESYEAERQRRLDRPTQTQRAEPQAATAAERSVLAQLGAPNREAFLANRTAPTADWLRAHPEFFSDPQAHARITGADALAKGRGLEVDSPEYFRYIEETALSQTTTRREPAERSERSAIPGAGPSRDAPGPTGRTTRNGDIFVSADDKTTASWLGVDPVEYVRERDRLKNVGEWPYRRGR